MGRQLPDMRNHTIPIAETDLLLNYRVGYIWDEWKHVEELQGFMDIYPNYLSDGHINPDSFHVKWGIDKAQLGGDCEGTCSGEFDIDRVTQPVKCN